MYSTLHRGRLAASLLIVAFAIPLVHGLRVNRTVGNQTEMSGECKNWCQGDVNSGNNLGRHCAPGDMAHMCGSCTFCSSASVRRRRGTVGLRIAFVGNSMTFYNDLPHLVKSFLERGGGAVEDVKVGACLRPGTNLDEVWHKGALFGEASRSIGNRDMYSTVQDMLSYSWDIVILQDDAMYAVGVSGKSTSKRALREKYAPLLSSQGRTPLIVLYPTWSYRAPITFNTFTARLRHGHDQYREVLMEGGLGVSIAPTALACQKLRNEAKAEWRLLYLDDNYHPSALGSFLNAAVIATTIANSSRFATLFPQGLQMNAKWPSTGVAPPHGGRALPPRDHMVKVLAAAGLTCSKDTGGKCGWSSCNGSRNSQCVDGKCVCGAGQCAVDGKCV